MRRPVIGGELRIVNAARHDHRFPQSVTLDYSTKMPDVGIAVLNRANEDQTCGRVRHEKTLEGADKIVLLFVWSDTSHKKKVCPAILQLLHQASVGRHVPLYRIDRNR